jgi:hypothetical protein
MPRKISSMLGAAFPVIGADFFSVFGEALAAVVALKNGYRTVHRGQTVASMSKRVFHT